MNSHREPAPGGEVTGRGERSFPTGVILAGDLNRSQICGLQIVLFPPPYPEKRRKASVQVRNPNIVEKKNNVSGILQLFSESVPRTQLS